ncbi:hypothetical protein [Chryseobacterium daeguense]|uniref:hypothetical protein n=1 Tax=Chryseobacterium daeguense TaxID=412438 RepID=UPI000418460F|nr:hypothetical protein [Chryseobacterium daeguense]
MKIIYSSTLLLCVLTACTKSETQYRDKENKRETVNDRASDTIKPLNEISDTLRIKGDSTDVKTDNE